VINGELTFSWLRIEINLFFSRIGGLPLGFFGFDFPLAVLFLFTLQFSHNVYDLSSFIKTAITANGVGQNCLAAFGAYVGVFWGDKDIPSSLVSF
jgi:hypothetical protein